MSKQISRSLVAGTAIIAILLSQPLAIVHAQQASDAKPAAKVSIKRKPSHFRANLYAPKSPDAPTSLYGCIWPYRNMGPPCWSTWPEGDPNYHGTRPGPH